MYPFTHPSFHSTILTSFSTFIILSILPPFPSFHPSSLHLSCFSYSHLIFLSSLYSSLHLKSLSSILPSFHSVFIILCPLLLVFTCPLMHLLSTHSSIHVFTFLFYHSFTLLSFVPFIHVPPFHLQFILQQSRYGVSTVC